MTDSVSDNTLGRSAPTVAVVIPARNAGRFLDVTLTGVAYQSYPVAEVVVVDDASEDNTFAVASAWESRLPVTVIRLATNSGPGAARNAGVEASTADLVAFLDADDLWLPEHLHVLVSYLDEQTTIVSPKAVIWHTGRGIPMPAGSPQKPLRARDQMKELLQGNRVFAGSLVSRSLLETLGGMPTEWPAEDYELWLRLVTAGARVVSPEHVTVLYRRYGAGLSTSPRIFEGEVRVLNDWIEENPGLHQRPARRAVRLSQARLDLFRSYEAARESDRRTARSLARAALTGGDVRLRIRSLSMIFFPRFTTRLRDERHSW